MAVALLLTSVILSSIVSGLGTTSATRAEVQSQAAADAGIAVARAGLQSGSCLPTYASATTAVPRYSAATSWRSGVTGDWVPGCPSTPVSATTQVRVISTGTAAAPGIARQSRGDVSYVEAVFSPPAPSLTTTATGPAVYSYSGAGFTSSGRLVSVAGSFPTVLVKTGSVTCSGASSGQADWVVENGEFTGLNACTVTGNVWSSDAAELSGAAQVTGNLSAAGVSITGSSVVGGSVSSTAGLTISGASRINANATASSLTMSGSARIAQNAWVYGNSSIVESAVGGKLTTRTTNGSSGAAIGGGTTTTSPAKPGTSPYTTPTRPAVPAWMDYEYLPTDWPDYVVKTVSGNCTYEDIFDKVAEIGSSKGVLDARGCTNPERFTLGYRSIALKNDLVIVADKFVLESSGGFTSADTERLWLITPDTLANSKPTCRAGGGFTVGGAFTIDSKITTMIYSPCKVAITSAATMAGQVYGGTAEINGAATLRYTALGLPRLNLNSGTPLSATPAGAVWGVVSTRNRTSAG